MRQAIPEDIRDGMAHLEGFSLRTIADYLVHLSLSKIQLRTISSMIATGRGCDIFTAPSSGLCACLVDGRSRTIALGSGKTRASFVEAEAERLVFFPRPGQAESVTLNVETWGEDASSSWQATLTRDEQYRYTLDGQWLKVVASTREQVQCQIVLSAEGLPSHVTLRAEAFWPFIFTTSSAPQTLFLTHISAAHTAALLGLSLLTIERRIGEGKLPALRPQSKYPGVGLAGLHEFLAYRRQFPQGHPNSGRIEAWQRTWREAYRRENDGDVGRSRAQRLQTSCN